MTDTNQARELAKRAGRVALGPVTTRLDLLRRDMEILFAKHAELAASLEQAVAANQRLEAYFDRYREEVAVQLGGIAGDVRDTVASLLEELAPEGGPGSTGEALRLRIEHAMLHAEAMGAETRRAVERDLADLRSSTRLTQSLVERALAAGPPAGPATVAGAPTDDAPTDGATAPAAPPG
ncbi:MAG TPA: hypothetical protein VHK88_01560, partial [Aquihabitans sp.]|nr:hypothetical protein [Aquihabitans sp.]